MSNGLIDCLDITERSAINVSVRNLCHHEIFQVQPRNTEFAYRSSINRMTLNINNALSTIDIFSEPSSTIKKLLYVIIKVIYFILVLIVIVMFILYVYTYILLVYQLYML